MSNKFNKFIFFIVEDDFGPISQGTKVPGKNFRMKGSSSDCMH